MSPDTPKPKGRDEPTKLTDEELADVAGGVLKTPIILGASSCSCRTSCTHVNVTESSGSAALSGDA